jgi:hypothetical protein
MSRTVNLEGLNMASQVGPESIIFNLMALRSGVTLSLPDDLVSKLQKIKESMGKPEGSDHLGWRRGATNNNNNSSASSPSSSTTGSHRHGGGNDWRSGSQQSSYKPPSSSNHRHGGGHHHHHHHHQGSSSSSNNSPIPHQKYVSRFRNNDTPVEETILNQVILNKLNKFSEVNYEEVKQFLKQILDSDDTSFLKEFMNLVFRKAASEPVFCPLYARLICELSSGYSSLQKEFETLYKDYLRIFEDIDESKCPDYETFLKRNVEKQYRLGYSQFLAELISKGVLQTDELILLFSKILEQISKVSRESKEKISTVDEYVQCILRMTKALKNNPMIVNLEIFEEPIQYLIQNQSSEFPGLSKKSQFGLMDCLDILKGK